MDSWYTLQQATQAHIEGFYLERDRDRLAALADDRALARRPPVSALRILLLRLIGRGIHPTILPAPMPLEPVSTHE